MATDPIKSALRRIPYGFYGITSRHGDEINVMVATWLTQASFEPRLVALALARDAYSYGLIEQGGVFAVNIFNKADAEAIKPFTKGHAKNPDKMKDARYSPGPETGCPILEDAAAYLECRVINRLETGGDHDIILAEVVGAGVHKPGEAADTLSLPHLGWSYAG